MSNDDADVPFGDPKPSMRYGVKASEWRRLSREAIARDGYTCRYCGSVKPPMQCDHMLPFTRGGTNDPENLAAACSDCNRSKGNRLLSEWKTRP